MYHFYGTGTHGRAQAGPSNAAFFLFYDALNAIGAAAILGGDGSGGNSPSPSSSLWPTALHLGASSVATVPANLVRTPAEVVKQRLQVCRRKVEWSEVLGRQRPPLGGEMEFVLGIIVEPDLCFVERKGSLRFGTTPEFGR